jgi:hypothetical protein
VAGSHSLTRAKPKPGEHDPDEALARLTEVKHHPNRHFLGRVPLVESAPGSGLFDLRPRARDGKRGTIRRSGCLKMTAKGDALSKELRADVHVARFMSVPAKENGFDIEGIAARGERVFLGLRGPARAAGHCCSSSRSRSPSAAASSSGRSAPPARATSSISSISPASAFASSRSTATPS